MEVSWSCSENVNEFCANLLGSGDSGLDPGRCSQAEGGESNQEGPGVPLEVPEKERQKGDLETMYGASFVATWGRQHREGSWTWKWVLITSWKESPG